MLNDNSYENFKKLKKQKKIKFWYSLLSVFLLLFLLIFLIFFALNKLEKNNFQKIEKKEGEIKITKQELNKKVQKTDTQVEKNYEEMENHQKLNQGEEIPKNENQLEKIETEKEIVKEKENKKENKKDEVKKNIPIKKTILVSISMRGDRLGYFFAYENEKMIRKGIISSGKKHYESPIGSFHILEKKKEFTSKLYPNPDGSNNMNNMLRLTWDGIALHEGNPNLISHGCIHIDPKDASWLFNWAKIGTPVYITTKKINPKNNLENEIKEIKKWNAPIIKARNEKREEIEYWPNGNFKRINNYKGEYLDGWQYEYWPNGFIKKREYYVNGRWSGHRIKYWENGQIMEDFWWKNDELKMGKAWDRNGKLLYSFDIRRDDEK